MKKIVSLKEVCESDYGVTASATEQPTGTHFLRITDIVNFTDYSGVPFVDIDDEDRRKKLLKQNDIVVARTGATVGASHLFRGTEPTVFASYLVRFRPKTSDVDPVFVSYVLNSPAWKQFIFANAHSKSAQPNLSAAAMMDFQFSLPEIREQQKIASVLKALDDKIAANNRAKDIALDLIKTLGGKPTNTVKLSVLCERSTRSIKPETIEAKTVLHHSLPAFDLGAPAQEDPATIKSNKFSLERPCVLLSKLNPHTPRIWSVPVINEDVPMIASSEFVVLQPTTCRQAQLFAATVQPELFHHLESLTGGTSKSHQRVRPADILTSEVPDTRTLSAEESQMLELLTLRFESFVAENQVLARTRDELLPLLMSGRITVGEAEDAADVAGTAASES